MVMRTNWKRSIRLTVGFFSVHSILSLAVDRILQSFDWLAAFHLDMLQTILFIAV
jgi:hypothetical protein